MVFNINRFLSSPYAVATKGHPIDSWDDGVFVSSSVPVAVKVITLIIMIAFKRIARRLECNFLFMCEVI